MGLQAQYRAAAVSLLNDYAASVSIPMQVYRARPATLYPPTGFVDRMADTIGPHIGPTIAQHVPVAEVMVVWGLFDSGEAVDQRDAFVDGFHEWTRTRIDEAGANSLVRTASLSDDPTWVPDWLPEEQQRTYYATRIVLEGFATD